MSPKNGPPPFNPKLSSLDWDTPDPPLSSGKYYSKTSRSGEVVVVCNAINCQHNLGHICNIPDKSIKIDNDGKCSSLIPMEKNYSGIQKPIKIKPTDEQKPSLPENDEKLLDI
jgi:hypothetical protein